MLSAGMPAHASLLAVWNQWNGMVECNSEMEYWNDLLSLKSEVWGCHELQHHNGSRKGKCKALLVRARMAES